MPLGSAGNFSAESWGDVRLSYGNLFMLMEELSADLRPVEKSALRGRFFCKKLAAFLAGLLLVLFGD